MALLNSSRKKSSGGKARESTENSNSSNAKNRISKRPRTVLPLQRKAKSKSGPAKKQRRVYTEEELGIPKLNTITPVGVDMPKGKKKGKVFVDDQEGMMTILSIVNASKEGQIESKLMKSRHMEEVREARRKEAEARQEQKESKLNETKDSLRRKRRRKPGTKLNEAVAKHQDDKQEGKTGCKRVSFAEDQLNGI